MIKLRSSDKPRWRETTAIVEGRHVCVALTPSLILFRLKGKRSTIDLPFNSAYLSAAYARGNETLEKKKRRRPVRRGALAMGVQR